MGQYCQKGLVEQVNKTSKVSKAITTCVQGKADKLES